MKFSSRLIEEAVNAFIQFPGVGRRTALRMVLYLLKQDVQVAEQVAEAITKLRREIRFCRDCHNIADEELCAICRAPQRNRSLICVVEDIRDVIAIESTQHYNGLYHVLNGLISPIDGMGPEDIHAESLIERVEKGSVEEIILALSSTIEGDTTAFYLAKKLASYPVRITAIARGIAFGSQLEYTDELTLGRSILHRIPYEKTITTKYPTE